MSVEPRWTLQYVLTRKDYEALNWYFYRHDWRLAVWPVVVMLGVVIFVAARFAGEGLPWFITLPACLVAGAVDAAFMWFYVRFRIASSLKAWPSEGRNFTLVADDERLDFQNSVMNSQSGWQAIVRVASGREAVYLFLSGRLAYLVPLRAFQNPSDAAVFAAWAAERIEAARRAAAEGGAAR